MKTGLTKFLRVAAMATTSGAALLAGASMAHGQAVDEKPSIAASEIVVTARKREETALQVPVSVTALGSEQLQNFAVNNVDSMARAVPSLIIGEGGGTQQGGIIAIRGISGADNNALNDQAVSFNIDGVAIGRATIRRMADFDTAQVEVLKGPQALFFGKNSPGGIIVIHSADPTPDLEAKISSGYEFKAKEWRTDAYVSGPLSDSLGFRVAGFYSDMKGWAKNIVEANPAYPFIVPVGHGHAPDKSDWGIRGTLKFEDDGPFDAKLKLTYSKMKGQGSTANTQFVACPLGRPQTQIGLPNDVYIDDCRADRINQSGYSNVANAKTLFPMYSKYWDKGLTQDQYQFLASLEMNYHVTDSLTFTSQTGFYKQNLNNTGNYTQSFFNDGATYWLDGQGNLAPAGSGAFVRRWDLSGYFNLHMRELSQELRLTSSFDGPINFMIGGLITDTKGDTRQGTTTATFGSAFGAIGLRSNHYHYAVDGKSQSIFGQIIVNPIPEIEISGGARSSWEQKKLVAVETLDVTSPRLLNDVGTVFGLPDIDRKVSFHDISPEFTVAFKPNPDLNIYAGYKEGFLSGGFAAVVPQKATFQNGQHIYKPQETKGFEGGIKAALLNRALRVNLAYYNYKTTGLQVGLTINGVNPVLLNAASARTEGVEFDFTYDTPLQGLSLNGALNYNKGKYLDFIAPCYRGQPSEDCFLQTNDLTGITDFYQDLKGKPLVRAPRWTGNAGFNYETSVGSGFKIGLSGNVTYSDAYFTDTADTPGGKQPSYTLLDASLRFGADDDSWEVAFIGRNLTNEYYFVRSSDSPFSGSNPGAYPSNSPYRLLADTAASIARGRELWVRLSYKFSGK